MKVAVVGSRSFTNYELLVEVLSKHGITELVTGGAKGADTLAAQYGNELNIPVIIYPPNYMLHGSRAPLVRNELIVDNCDYIIAFWDGKSTGTGYTIDYARKKAKRVVVINA